jgi:hypothetical protein
MTTRTFTAHGLEFTVESEVFIEAADFDIVCGHLDYEFNDEEEMSFDEVAKMHRSGQVYCTMDEDGAGSGLGVNYKSKDGRIMLVSVERFKPGAPA